MVVSTGLRLVGAGMVLGVAVSLVLGRVIGSQLVGVTAYDPATLAATTLLLTIAGAIACWIRTKSGACRSNGGAALPNKCPPTLAIERPGPKTLSPIFVAGLNLPDKSYGPKKSCSP